MNIHVQENLGYKGIKKLNFVAAFIGRAARRVQEDKTEKV